MKNISIPEPCHENWADFTPTQKGAFCGSCQIDVVDFSNKTPNQIKSILHENSGKHMCGRFKKSQLVELNDDFSAWQNQSVKTFQSKFLYACLIVFGMTLFTGCSSNNQHIMGDVISLFQEQNANNNAQLNLLNPITETDTIKKPTISTHKMGKVKYIPKEVEPKIVCTPPDSLADDNEIFIKGEVIAPQPIKPLIMGRFTPNEVDTIKNVETEVEIENLYDDEMVDGGLSIDPSFYNFLEDTSTIETPIKELESIPENQLTPVESFTPYFTARLFPNPVKSKAVFELKVTTPDLFNIYLYAVDGKKVKGIFEGKLEEGIIEFNIDLNAYQAGTYLIVINSSKQKESLRIEKVK